MRLGRRAQPPKAMPPKKCGFRPAFTGALIQHSFPYIGSYQNTDQVFIDQWKKAIDASEKIFTGLTLVISPDLGLPEFRNNPIRTIHPDNTLFAQDCKDAIAAAAAPLPTDTDFRSCEAKTEILSYFVTVAGPNAKATQVGGLTASSPKDLGNIGIAGVKLLTSLSPPPSPLIRGGAEFDFPVSGSNRQEEGCPSFPKGVLCQPLTVVDAAYNVLNDIRVISLPALMASSRQRNKSCSSSSGLGSIFF